MNHDRIVADMYHKMSQARSHLGRALLVAHRIHEHDENRNPFGKEGCACSGCEVRISIELALKDLEP
jgi:hypothetical protein